MSLNVHSFDKATEGANCTLSLIAKNLPDFEAQIAKFQNCDSHPYLLTKGIKAHGALQNGDNLIIPLYNAGKVICGLQKILPDGRKLFEKGTEKKGAFYVIGETNLENEKILITEGFATAASLHEATGHTCVVAFDAGNLMSVAESIVHINPNAEIIICADNDQFGERNTGVDSGKAVAAKLGLKLAIPEFSNLENEPTDFNDLAELEGAEKVKYFVDNASKLDITANKSSVPEGYYYKDGFLWVKATSSKSADICLCTAIYVDAYSADEDDSDHSLILNWQDDKTSKLHRWVMPLHLLEDSAEMRKHLYSNGFKLLSSSNSAKVKLLNFLHQAKANKRITSVSKTGWYKDKFIMAGKTYPPCDDIMLSATTSTFAKFKQMGTLKEWQDEIVKYCVGNHKLILALSIAFATPLLKLLEFDSAGFHYVGSSSIGKTTALKVASSVWGSDIKTWRATGNAIEYIAACHNDSCLLLDELGQANSKEVGNTVYTLANNQGKARLQASIEARKPFEWTLFFISTGELTLEDKMREAGLSSHAGQEVRMINIPASSGGSGIFNCLHDKKSGSDLSLHLSEASEKYKGVAIDQFLSQLTQHDQTKIISEVRESMDLFNKSALKQGYDGQVKRVANKFALLYAANVLAINYGVLNYTADQALESLLDCFNCWLENRETPHSLEQRKLIDKISLFFEKYYATRFEDITDDSDRMPVRVQNIAGYKSKSSTGYDFWVTPQIFKDELIKGYNKKFAIDTLTEAGIMIVPFNSVSTSVKKRIPELGKSINVYHFTDKVFACDPEPKHTIPTNLDKFF